MPAALRLVRDEPASIADADLVARVRAGDRWAEDALYRRYARPVAGLTARLLGGGREDVEDIVHDSFVSAFEKIHRLRDQSAFRSWLMQIAVTHVRRLLRTRRLKRALGLVPSSDEVSLERLASTEVSPELRAELAVIDAMLRRMPANDRIAWVLRHVEGHRLEEVAQLCECSLATAKRRIASAERAMSAVIEVKAEDGR